MASIGDYFATFKADFDGFIAPLKSAQKEAREFQKTVKPLTQLLDDMGHAMTRAGQSATVGLTLPIVAMGAVAIKNFNESAEAAALMENAIRSTGGAAGKSADELRRLATSLQGNSIFEDDTIIQKVITQLLTFTNVVGAAFDRGAQAALNMSAVLGQDLQSSAIQVGKALNDPVAGVSALQRVGVKLTDAQKDLVKSFMAVNDIAGAQNVILQELEKEFGGAAKAASAAGSGPFKQLTNQIGNMTESWGALIQDAMQPFIKKASELVTSMDSWSTSTKASILVVAGLGAGIGPVLMGLGQMSLGVSGLIKLYTKFAPLLTGTVIPAVTAFGSKLAALAIANGPLLLTVAAVAGLGIALWKLYDAWKANIEAQGDAVVAISRQEESTIKAARALKDHYGVAINRGTMSTTEWGEAISEAAATAAWFERQTKGLAEAHTTLTPAVKRTKEEIELAKEAAKKLADQMESTQKIISTNARDMASNWKDANEQMMDSMDLRNKQFSEQLAKEIKDWDALFDALDKVTKEFELPISQNAGTFGALIVAPLPVTAGIRQVVPAAKEAAEALKAATEDVKRSAGAIFDAMFIKGENVFASLQNLLKGGALSLGRSIFEDITGALLGPVKKAFDDFFTVLLESTGIKAFVTGLGNKIGGMLSGIFGGGADVAGSVTGSAGGAAGAIPGIGGGASSAAGGGAGAFAGIGSAIVGGVISSIGSFLSGMRLEGTMNAVEANTRFTYIELKDTMEQILWPMHGLTTFIANEMHTAVTQLDAIFNAVVPLNDSINRIGGGNAPPSTAIHIENLTIQSSASNLQELMAEINREVKGGSMTLYSSALTR